MSSCQPCLFLGVTGHRDIPSDARESLLSRLDEILTDVERRFPGIPKTLLSPLAEGADRLVAEAALRRGYQLWVPLPMARTEYEMDFSGDASRREFASLLARADAVFPLPQNMTADSADAPTVSPEWRTAQYVALGQFISNFSQVLICLFDGNDTHLRGGTAHVAAIKRTGAAHASASSRWRLPDYGLIYNLVTPRLKHNSETVGPRFSWKVEGTNVEPDPEKAATAIRRMYQAQARYAMQVGSTENPATDSKSFYEALFQQADELAQAYQRRLKRVFIGIFAAAIAAAVLLGANSDLSFCFPEPEHATFWTERFLLLGGYLAAIATALALFGYAKKRALQDQYQDIRALAEGFRVQMHWATANIEESVADYYLEKQRSSLDWIRGTLRQAFLFACARFPQVTCTGDAWATRSARVRADWLLDQERYFTAKTASQRQQLHRNERAAKVLFTLGLLSATLLFANRFLPYAGLLPRRDSHEVATVVETILCITNLLPVLAGLIKYRVEKLGWTEHVLLYTQTAQIFRNARRRLEELDALPPDTNTSDRKLVEQCILRDLGAAALAENADWLVLHRFKEIQLPG